MNETTQELTTTTPNAVVAQSAVDQTGLSGTVRLKPTKLLLVQGTTRDSKGAKPGQLLDVMNEVGFDTLTVVPLRVSKSRSYFPNKSDFTIPPTCRSNDGIVPSPFAEVPQSKTCGSCPMGQWVGKKRPPCDEKLNLLVIVKETGIPRYFQVGGIGIKSLKLALQRISEDIQINKMKGKALSLYDYFFTIRGEKVVGKAGVYYVPRFDDLKKVSNPGDFGPLFEEFVVKAHAAIDEEEEIVENEATANGAVNQVIDAEVVTEV